MPYWEGVRIAISDDHGSAGGHVDASREEDEGSEPASYVGYEIAYTDEPPCEERGDCGTLHAVFESKLVERGQDFVFIDVRERCLCGQFRDVPTSTSNRVAAAANLASILGP
jgi:hypothetical protein